MERLEQEPKRPTPLKQRMIIQLDGMLLEAENEAEALDTALRPMLAEEARASRVDDAEGEDSPWVSDLSA